MKTSIIAIGDELLLGQVTDTNSGSLARMMAPYGWEVSYVQTIGDNATEITSAIDRAFTVADVVLTTGGLGPTKDDITKSVLRDYFGGEMITDPSVTENIERLFARRGITLNPLTAAQAIVPSSCRVIQNLCGTAPIMWFEKDGKVLVSMPGVPFETVTMFRDEVLPQLLKRFRSDVTIVHEVTMVKGYTESALAMKIAPWEETLPEYLHLAYLPKQGIVRLRLDGVHKDGEFIRTEVSREAARLRRILGDAVLATDDVTPEEVLLRECRDHGLKFASAESCTGGNIARRLTLIPGASDVVMGAVVSYANSVKTGVLGVDAALIETLGAVSEPVAAQMAEGVLRVTRADLAVATSGIAGPGGAVPGKPVGTVCLAVVMHRGEETLTHTTTVCFNGDRARVIDSASTRALLMAVDMLRQSI